MNLAAAGLLLDTLRLSGAPGGEGLRARWAGADLATLLRMAEHEGAQLWLYRRVQQLGVELPEGLAGPLRRAAHEAALANLRIDAVTGSVLDALGSAGIPVILIKGQARRALVERYPWADAKRLSDVDLLLPADRVDQGWELLRANGFEPTYGPVSPFHTPHHRPVLHDRAGVTVELHVSTALTFPAAEAWQRQSGTGTSVTWEGRTVQVPGATELLWQALGHGVEDEVKGWRLRAFLDAAVVIASGQPVDWQVIATRIGAGEVRNRSDGSAVPAERIRRWLGAAVEVAGREAPAGFAVAGRARLERTLAWRAGVLAGTRSRVVRERLLEEGARVEAGLPVTPGVPGTGALRLLRRRGSSLLARAGYRLWWLLSGGNRVGLA